MALSLGDISLTEAWVDAAATYSGLASASSFVNCKGNGQVLLVWGGTIPSGNVGDCLSPGDGRIGTASAIWVRALSGVATVNVGNSD